MATEQNNAEMPFLDHLEELRWRILWSLAALIVAVIAAFIALQKFDIFMFLERPILPYLGGNKLKYPHPGDPLSVLITASFSIGIVVALPVILYQAWAFLAPALYKHEKRLVLPVIFGAIALFVAPGLSNAGMWTVSGLLALGLVGLCVLRWQGRRG